MTRSIHEDPHSIAHTLGGHYSNSDITLCSMAAYEQATAPPSIIDSSLAISDQPHDIEASAASSTPPELPPEVLMTIFKIWAKDDVPIVSPLTGGLCCPGWWTALRVPKFREIALSAHSLWAGNVTAVPKAFGMALANAGNSPLHFELSPSVPCLDWDGVSRLEMKESVDIWGEMISNDHTVAQVTSLVLKESNALHQFARAGKNAEFPARLSGLHWSTLKRTEFLDVLPRSPLRAPLEHFRMHSNYFMRSRSFPPTLTLLSNIFFEYKDTLKSMHLSFSDERRVPKQDVLHREVSNLGAVRVFRWDQIRIEHAELFFRCFKLPIVDSLTLELVGLEDSAPEAFDRSIDVLDCMHHVCELFRVQVWTTHDPGRFAVRLEAWRKLSFGDTSTIVGTDCSPAFDLQYEAIGDRRGGMHAVRYMIERMVAPGTSPTVLFLDLSLLTKDTPRPSGADLRCLGARVHVPHHPVHHAILNGNFDDLLSIRQSISEHEGRSMDQDDDSQYYTEQEMKTLRDMSLLRDCMLVSA